MSSTETEASKVPNNYDCENSLQFKKKGLHVANLNIQHFLPKIDEIKYHLSQKENKMHILGLCETFLNENTTNTDLSIPNYNFERRDRSNKSGGGILIYVLDSLPYKRRRDLESDSVEVIWLEICFSHSKPFLLGFVYRPPNSKREWCETFSKTIDIIDTQNIEYHIIGDFNFEYIPQTKKFQTAYWNEFVQHYGISQLVDCPTRVSQKSSTIIDHLYSNRETRIIEVFVSPLAISDHSPVCFTRSAREENPCSTSHKCITYRSFNKFDLPAFQMDLAFSNINDVEKIIDPNTSLTMFYHIVNNVLQKHAPLKQKRVKFLSQPNWLTQDIKDAIRMRDSIDKKTNFASYKTVRNKVTYMIKSAKRDFYNNAVKQNTDPKFLWKNMRDITGNSSKNIFIPKSIFIENREITGEKNIASTFNDHFINICKIIKQKTFNENDFKDLQLNLEENLKGKHFNIQPITPFEVKSFIEKLNCSKATGIDGIGPQILKYCGDFIVLPITAIINNSIRLGIFPDALKASYVMPVYKSNDKQDPNNYRPISILPSISKIFERHIANQLMTYLTQTNVLHKYQSGFRKNHSCQTALIRLLHDWYSEIDNGSLVGTVFLDLRKAFDLVDHQILLYKLKLHHFSNETLNIFESYLNNRTQIVKVGNIKSDQRVIKCGVPQGSILGPILFILYINDINLHIQQSVIDLYADDTTLYASGKTKGDIEHNLQEDLNRIMKWCDSNNMAIHPGKTTCMLIGTPYRTRQVSDLTLKINDTVINNVLYQKLLGIIIDKNLKWDNQINAVCKKVNSKLFLLKRILNYLNDNMKSLFYNSYIMPIFDYCCIIWGFGKQSHISKLTSLQKRAAKIILCEPKTTPSSDLFKTLQWLTFKSRCTYHIGIMIYKSLENNVPEYISDLIQISQNNRYTLRSTSKQNLATATCKTNIKQQSFQYISVQVWNSIPMTIRMSKSLNTFKFKFKHHLLSLQSV